MEIYRTDEYAKWFKTLKDHVGRAQIERRIHRIEKSDYFGDTKPIDAGISELRFFQNSGYRIYYTTHGDKVLLLLIGGDKSTQSRDIEKAKLILEKAGEWYDFKI